MDETQLAAALGSIKSEMEEKASSLQERIDRANLVIARNTKKLAEIRDEYDQRARNLWQEFLGGKILNAPAPAAVRPQGRRVPRGSLNEPLLALLKELRSPTFTVPLVYKEWNHRNPEPQVGRATLRGILEKLVEQGHLEVVDPGGVGSANPRQYRLKEVGKTAKVFEMTVAG